MKPKQLQLDSTRAYYSVGNVAIVSTEHDPRQLWMDEITGPLVFIATPAPSPKPVKSDDYDDHYGRQVYLPASHRRPKIMPNSTAMYPPPAAGVGQMDLPFSEFLKVGSTEWGKINKTRAAAWPKDSRGSIQSVKIKDENAFEKWARQNLRSRFHVKGNYCFCQNENDLVAVKLFFG